LNKKVLDLQPLIIEVVGGSSLENSEEIFLKKTSNLFW